MVVVDKSGNSNTCMVFVDLQDKLPPFIDYCPPDITIDCNIDFKDTDATGLAVGIDNCAIEEVTFSDTESLNSCGEGVVYRLWTLVDTGGEDSHCSQKIFIEEYEKFYMDEKKWPRDTLLYGCVNDTDVMNLGAPLVDTGDNCSLVASSYEDIEFTFVDEACLKLVREWTVIDWCHYDPETDEDKGIWTESQIISILNLNGPTFENECADVTICQSGDQCTDLVLLTLSATDDCTPHGLLKWHWDVYIHEVGYPSSPAFSGDSYDATDNYPPGTHRVVWKVADQCGNVSVCDYKFTVVDCKAPVPYCLSSVTTVIMPSTGELEVWASDFDAASVDNCTPKDQLRFSFSPDVDATSITFYCSDIEGGVAETHALDVYVTDLIGNQDFCKIDLILQDNAGNTCQDPQDPSADLSGSITTEHGKSLKNVTIKLNSQLPEFPIFTIIQSSGNISV